ncbi:hypothetical protein ACFLUU_10300 [Chloroflexota bacterium]
MTSGFSMSQKARWYRIMRHLALSLILVVFLWLTNTLPASAQSAADYFQISFDPVSFSQDDIHGDETFQATILGRVSCTNNLPMPVSEASITSRVIAEHTVSGARVTLNSSYTISIKPFPTKEGDTTEINQVVPLQFPAQAKSGGYNVVGELIEAKVKVAFAPVEVTEYLPQSQLMGSVEYTAPEPTTTPSLEVTTIPPPMASPPPTDTPTPTPAPASTPAPEQTPALPEYAIPWWVWLIVTIAIVTTIVNIRWFLQHRGSPTG